MNVPPSQTAAHSNHANGFDVIRLALALLVVYTHAFLVGGHGPEPTTALFKAQSNLGTLSVLGFFGISGYLVTASWDRSSRLSTFAWKRVLRIFPAFWVCLLVIAAVVGPILDVQRGGSLAEYSATGAEGAIRYVWSNSLLQVNQWTIGSTLEGAPYPESLDGSLWSIFPEFICYGLTAVLGLFAATRQNRAIFAGLIVYLTIIHVAFELLPGAWTAVRGPTLLMLGKGPMFFLAYTVGAALWIFREWFVPNPKGAALAGAMVLLTLKFGGAVVFAPIGLPVFLIYLAHSFNGRLRWDLSYGVYLYHFPLLQLLALSESVRSQSIVFLGLGLVGSLAVAALSWNFIEAPALRLKVSRAARPTAEAAKP